MTSLSQLIDNVVRPDLENVFGPALTARIIMAARAKSNAPIIGMTEEDFDRLIDSISGDDRVLGIWGNAGSNDRKKRWKEASRKISV